MYQGIELKGTLPIQTRLCNAIYDHTFLKQYLRKTHFGIYHLHTLFVEYDTVL